MPILVGMTRLVLLLVLLTGCAGPIEPPPYDVWLVDVPAEHVAHLEAVVAAWNAQVGHEALVLRDGAPRGRCGVLVSHAELGNDYHGETVHEDECRTRVRYGTLCVVAHELGHALGLDDDDGEAPRNVMWGWDCPITMPTAEDGAAVRERWGLE